jgi:uncharacterized protein
LVLQEIEKEKIQTLTMANPGPLGLLGFGMTTALLALLNAGILSGSGIMMIFAMGVFYGGIAQIIAGIMEFRKGNTFGTTAFISYGLFWISLVAILLMPDMGISVHADATSMGAYFFMWGLFTTFMFAATLRMHTLMKVIFGTLALLFFTLTASEMTGSSTLKYLAGAIGLVCGFSAIYVAFAELLNEAYKKDVMPLN